MKTAHIEQVIDGLSRLVYQVAKNLSSEQYYPGQDPDKMDSDIEDLTKQFKLLTKMRTDFEIICTRCIIKE